MSHTFYGSRRWDMAYWTNLELGYEIRRWTGFTFRTYLGLAVLMNPEDNEYDVDDYEEPLEISNVLVYGGCAFGWAL